MSTSSATSSLGPTTPGPSSVEPSSAERSGDKLRPEKGTLTDWLQQELQKTVRQIQLLEATTSLAWWWCSLIGVLVVAIALDHWIWTLPTIARYLFWLTLVGTSAYWLTRHILPLILYRIHPLYAAKVVEQSLPELKNRLISWWELKHQAQAAPRGVVAAVGRQAVAQLREHDAAALIDSRPMLISIAVAILCTVFLSLYSLCAPRSAWVTTERVLFPWRTIAAPARVRIQAVKPGSAVIPQSLPCSIEVQVNGLRSDEKVTIRYTSRDQQILDQRIELTADVAGASYQGLLTTDGRGVQQDVEYWVEAGDAVAGPFSLTVTPLPQLSIQKIKLTYPAYTKLPASEQISDGSIEAIEGTEVELISTLNGNASKSYVEFHSLSPDNRPQRTLRTLTLEQQESSLTGKFFLRLNSQRENPTVECYTLRAVDPAGNAAPDPIVYPLRIVGDYSPEIRLTAGEQKTLQSSPRSSVTIEIDARDPDYGLANVDLEIAKGNLVLDTLSLLEQAEGIREPWNKKFQVRLSKWRLQAGEKIILTAIAKDNRTQPGSTQPEPNVTRSNSIEIEIIDTPEAEPLKNPASDNSDQAVEEVKSSDDNSTPNANSNSSTSKTESTGNKQSDSQGGGGSGSGSGSGDAQNQNTSNAGSNSAQGENNNANSQTEMSESGNSSSDPSKNSTSNSSSGESADTPSQPESSTSESNDNNASQSASKSDNQQNNNSDSRSPADNSSQPSSGDNSANSNQQPNETGSQKPNGGQATNNSTGSSPARTPDHDGEIMERLQQRLQQEKSSKGENSPANSGRNPNQNANDETAPNDSANDSSAAGEPRGKNDQPSGKSESSSQPKPSAGQNADGDGNKAESNSEQPTQNSSKPNEKSGNNQSGSGDESQPSAENQNSDQQTNPSGANNKSGMNNKPGTETTEPKSNNENNSQNSDSQTGQSKQEGAGQNQEKNGDPSSQSTEQEDSSNGAKSGKQSEKEKQGDNQTANSETSGQPSTDRNNQQSNDNSEMSGDNPSNDASGNKQNSKEPGQPNKQGDKAEANSAQGDSSEGNTGERNSNSGKDGLNQGENSQGKPGDNQSRGNSNPNSGSSSAQNSGANNPAASNQGKQAGTNAGSQPAGNQANAAETGRDGNMPGDNSQGSNPNEESEQANLEYSKRATNMALEYLERQKDQPDPELLKEMNWTKEDLNRFLDRWKKTRDAMDGQGNDRETAEKDLRSLGLRPPKSQKSAARSSDDQLRNLQESGQRMAPPKTLKSQFDAVKKALQDRQSNKK